MATGYLIRDARELETALQASSVQLTITSPPYADMKDYGCGNQQIGFGQDYESYLSDIEKVFRQVYRVSTDTSCLWVAADTSVVGGVVRMLPFDLGSTIARTGWRLRDIVIWHKRKTLPWSRKGQVRNAFEYLLFFTKTDEYKYHIDRIVEAKSLRPWWVRYPERYSATGKVPTNVWEYTIPTQGSWAGSELRHACPFPLGLLERIIDLCSDEGDLVFDPFAGSGTVLAQAECMGRQAVGTDLNSQYRDMYCSEVRPEAQRRWEAGLLERQAAENDRRRLAVTIPLLRQLKYPKQLARLLLRHDAARELWTCVNSVIAIGQVDGFVPSKQRFLKERILLVIDDEAGAHADHLRILELARHLAERPPLSKFGIEADIDILTLRRAQALLTASPLELRQLSLYRRGRFWWADRYMSVAQWGTEATDKRWRSHGLRGVPPILSNINVRQEVPEC